MDYWWRSINNFGSSRYSGPIAVSDARIRAEALDLVIRKDELITSGLDQVVGGREVPEGRTTKGNKRADRMAKVHFQIPLRAGDFISQRGRIQFRKKGVAPGMACDDMPPV